MTTQTTDFQGNVPNGVLSPQQAATLLDRMAKGEISDQSLESGDEPIVAAVDDAIAANAKKNEGANPPAADKPEPDPEKSVILAKDGVHTIDYQKLVDARQGEKHWKAQAQANAAELEALKAQAQQRADAGQAPTPTDNAAATAAAAIEQGVDPAIFGDYSEEALAKGIRQLVLGEFSKLRTELDSVVTPLKQTQALTAREAHNNAIYAAHPDADSIAESKELGDWIAAQPGFARAGYEAVLKQGTTAEIIEFFATFKAATGKSEAPAGIDPKVAARAQADKTVHPAPASLSDIPGGHAGPGNRFEAMDQLSPIALAEALQTVTPEVREQYLNRQM
jgi:hypothetical protein